jgi:hypothetical protein
VLILFIFLNVATLGFGFGLFVKDSNTLAESGPETLTIATPEIPGPVESANIVIK